jgi:hypothetical protein
MKTHRNRFEAKKHSFRKQSSGTRRIFKRLSIAGGERLEVRTLLTSNPLQNPADPWDVNNDSHVTAQDALTIINQLSSNQLSSSGSQAASAAAPMISALALTTSIDTTSAVSSSASSSASQSFTDVNDDGTVTPADVLSVINQLAAPNPNAIVEYRLEAEDLNGNPISTIMAGQNFQLAVFVHDLRNPPATHGGVFAGFTNVAYDPLATIPAGETTVNHDPLMIHGVSKPGFFTLVPSGDLSTPGQILGAGASGTSLVAPGASEQPLWTLTMHAASAGVEHFTSSFDTSSLPPPDGTKSGHDTLLYDLNPSVTASQIQFDTTQLTITPSTTVNISPANASLTEANSVTSPFVFTVSLSGPALTQNATVVFNTGGGTAVAGADYHATSGTLTFTVGGPTTQTIAVTGIDDQLSESDETFSVSLSAPTTVALGTTTTAVATILDDDPLPTVSILSPASQPDGSAPSTMHFTVNLSTASGQQTTVHFATQDVPGGAISTPGNPNQDYQATSGTLTFLAGQTSQVITVNILGDSKPEIDETFDVVLSSPSHLTLGTATGVGTILNDDLPTISLANVSIDEGNSDQTPFVFTASLSQPSPSQVTVVFTTTDGTAQGTAADPDGQPDYVPTSGTLTFAPNSTSATVTVFVNGNTVNELNEDFHVVLSNPVNAVFAGPGSLTASGTILNDDGPRVTITPPATIIAPQTGTADAVFNVQLLVPSAIQVLVMYTTVDGPGANGAKAADGDYVAQTSATLTFDPGITSQDITVLVNAETIFEPNENFSVSLTGVTSATIEQGNATATIQSSVAPPTVSFSAAQFTATQTTAVSTLLFTVNLSAPAAVPVQVTYTTLDGLDAAKATAGTDYTATSGMLTFAAGETQQVVTVPILGDPVNDQDEDFQVNLTSVTNLPPLNTPVVATGVIHNTNPPPNLTINNVSTTVPSSGTANVVFTVTLSHAAGEPIVVNYATADGTATVANGDYAATSGSLTFNPGDPLTKLVTVVANGDPINEANEDFTLNLTTTTPATVNISQAQGDGTLVSGAAPPTVSISSVSQNEGNSDTTPFVFTVSLSAVSGQDITVAYTTVDGTATTATSDYIGQAGTLTFAAGTTSQLITVEVNGDTLNEANEKFHVNLTSATHATISSTLGSGLGTILNDDPVPSISIGNVSHMEGDSGTQPFVFQVNLSTLSGQVVTVAYATADGTATVAAHDYLPTNGILTFNPGIGTLNVTVPVVGDLFKDPDEQFSVNLTNPVNVTLQQAQGIGVIQSNPNHTLDFTPSDISGTAFVDVNGNGKMDPGDTPLAGITVTLTGTPFNSTTPLTIQTTTAANGNYDFPNLVPGNYHVTYPQPAHFLPANLDFFVTNSAFAGSVTPIVDGNTFDSITFNASISLPGGVNATNTNFTVPGLDPKSFSLHDLWLLLHPSSGQSSSATQPAAASATSLAAPAAAAPAASTATPSISTAASSGTPLATSAAAPLASSDSAAADPFTQSGNTVTVNGTAGDDNFEFTAGAMDTVSFNGVTRTFDPAAVTKIIFDGGAGKNTVKLTGSSGNDVAALGLGSGTLTGANFSVSVSNATSLTVNGGGGGQDTATLQDSTSNDHLAAAGDEATLSNDLGYLTSLMAFSQVQAKSTNGGTDTAQVDAIDFALQQQGNWLAG